MDSYTAKQGDTWDMISYYAYGSEYYIAELILANPQYGNLIIFDGGEMLTIPIISNTETSLLAPWRQ